MQTVIEALRNILGTPDFYETGSGYSGTWDYGAMIEYLVGAILVMIVVSYIFRMLKWIFCK
ncbi:MAG: hypothetical protein E7549_01135 [Ruminococcaceae bacterium]|nr:hypothetical protein [Oscillospiraceae bacterium]